MAFLGPRPDPAWSPDGNQIAFRSGRDGFPEIYVMDVDVSNQTRLTFDQSGNVDPAWGNAPAAK